MNQETLDQEWRRIESHVDQLVCRFLRNNCPAIEYKTRVAGLLQLPPEYSEENGEETA